MRLHRLVFVSAAALLGPVKGAVETQLSTPGSELRIRPLAGDRSDALTTRLLRTHTIIADGEERAIPVSGVETLANTLKSTTTIDDELKALLAKGMNADDVFKLWGLNKADDVLGNPKLDQWVSYMRLFNKENPKHQTSLISTLVAHYGEDGVARMIGLAKQVPGAATMAKRLETEQIYRWMEARASPEDIFKLLKLHKTGYKLFEAPQVNSWMKYVDMYNKKYPRRKVSMFAELKIRYDEDTLVDMIIKASKVPSTKAIAVRVQSEQTQRWLSTGRSPNDVFTLLKMHSAKQKDTLFENPLFSSWLKYTDDFNERYPRREDLAISTMMEHFSSDTLAKLVVDANKNPSTESMSKRLGAELLQKWNRNGDAPDTVFTLLKLNKAGDKLFDSPLLPTWEKYITFFREQNPSKRVNMLAILRTHFYDASLSKMLLDAEKVPATKALASDLLDDLVIRWMASETDPRKVYGWLRVEGTADDYVGRDLYDSYVKFYKQHTDIS